MTPRRPHEVYITRGARLAAIALLLLTLIVGGGNLLATYLHVQAAQQAQHREQAAAQRAQRREQAAAQRAARVVERRICLTMRRLAALKPPPGNPASNPSRAFEDKLHATLDQLGPDLGCR